ncbi:MAG: hypothetical protein AAB402_01450 [Patescibacteria group bacterium]
MKKGFAYVPVLVVIFLVIAAGVVGYFVVTANKKSTTNANSIVRNVGNNVNIISNSGTSATNTTPSSNSNSRTKSLPMPVPLAKWDTSYNSGLKNPPSTPAEGQALCDSINDNNTNTWLGPLVNKSKCFEMMVGGFHDPKFCEKLEFSTAPDTQRSQPFDIGMGCIEDYISLYKNYDCAYHQKVEIRDRCYYVLGVPNMVSDPVRDCLKITDTFLKSSCESVNKDFDAATPMRQNIQDSVMVSCLLGLEPSEAKYFSSSGTIYNDFVKEASNQGNIDNCSQSSFFPDSERQRVKVLVETDKDQDGLNLFLENVFGTDDSKADSDGDSHPDLQEIQNGYNPLGPGKLEDAEILEANTNS